MSGSLFDFGKPVIIYVDNKEYPKNMLTDYAVTCGKERCLFSYKRNTFESSHNTSETYMIVTKYKETDKLTFARYKGFKVEDISETLIDKSMAKPFYPLRFYLQDNKLVQLESKFSLYQYHYKGLSVNEAYKDVPFFVDGKKN